MQSYEENAAPPNSGPRFGAIFSSNSSNLKIDGRAGLDLLESVLPYTDMGCQSPMTNDSFLKNDFRFYYYIIII